MEFICAKEDIQKSLSHAEGIVSSRTTLSILANVLLETKDNGLEISSTDLEVGFKTVIPAEIKQAGATTIQAKKLSELIKSFSSGNIHFTLEEQNRMNLASENPAIKANFKIMTLPKDDYPNIPEFSGENAFTLSQLSLKEMIRKTIFSASTDEARYFLNGIFFEKKEDNLTLVATDGKRLSLIKSGLQEKIDNFEIIIPSKVLNELIKILKDEGDCKISLTESKVFFQIGDTELVSNLLEGQFPNYNQVIPSETNNLALINLMDFIDAINRVKHMVDPKLAQIRFDILPSKLVLSGYHPDFGEAKDEIEIDYNGDEINIAFNYNYLLDALKEITQKDVELKMTNNKSPVILKGVEETNYFSVVMPMKLNEEE